MIVRDADAFLARFAALPPVHRATARGVMLVRPVGFSLAADSATDNVYMDVARGVDPERALAQHHVLRHAIETVAGLPVTVFDGTAATPDAVFPNNVFATVPGKLIVGAMRHPSRQREAQRVDVPAHFEALGYACARIEGDGVVSELTGPLAIDRARHLALAGLTERLNDAGLEQTHRALGLELAYAFPLDPREYHTNVVLAVLAGRAALFHRASLDPAAADAIARAYAPHAIEIDETEKLAFVANAIALADDQVWMSATAERALRHETRAALLRAGFVVHTVELDEIEKAGGSLRCCVAEVF
jgi:N-dimethylarginine dimethylaminohydrolase